MYVQFQELVKLAEILRGQYGCHWDKTQKLRDYIEHLQNELNEVKEAIEKQDYNNLREELGDMLFNLVMTAQIAKEEGHFSIDDVIIGIYTKIVFGGKKLKTAEEVLEIW